MGLDNNTELNMGSDEEETYSMEQDTGMTSTNINGRKNGLGADSGPGVHLAL